MPQTEKFPIGSRVGAKVPNGAGYKEVPMRVSGYDGLKGVIAVFLEDHGPWKKGQASVVSTKNLTPREEVKYIDGEPEDEGGQAIGWMELGGLSVSVTRAGDGAVLVQFERAPDYPEEYPVDVRVCMMRTGEDLWEGGID